MNKLFAIPLIALLACGITAHAQRTTRTRLKPAEHVALSDNHKAANTSDTIFQCDGLMEMSGYEKTLRSRKETFFMTNRSDRPVAGIRLTLEYSDMQGRQLHKRTADIACDIPAGETRLLSVPSWDLQQAWYYFRSKPVRTNAQATPYKVSYDIEHIIIPDR